MPKSKKTKPKTRAPSAQSQAQTENTSELAVETLQLAKGTNETKKISGSAMSDVATMPADPLTMVGVQAASSAKSEKKKSKKKKKAKVSSAEKAKAKLDNEADNLRKSGEPFRDYISRMDAWLRENSKRAIDLFRKFDLDGEGVLTFEEIKPGLRDLGIPCNEVELHLFCIIFDKYENEEVDYHDIREGMVLARQQEEAYTPKDIRPSIILTDRELKRCPHCKVARWDGEPYKQQYPRFILVSMYLVTFESSKAHPAHVTELVHSHITVQGLAQLVMERTGCTTSQMAVFTDRSRDVRTMLPPHKSLEECGYSGGTQDNPEELNLYYDYKLDFKDCPLLLCDHYFGQKIKVS